MIIISRWYTPDSTLGRFNLNGFHGFSLELPWDNNTKDISCIEEGEYPYFLRTNSKNGIVLELRNVEDRTNIQVHSGNYTRQILGCILVGDGIKHLDKDNIPDVTNSRNTLRKLISLAGTEGIIRIES